MRSESTTYGNLQHKSVIIVHMHYSFPEGTDTSIMKPCIHLVFISDTSITNPSKIVEVIDPRSIQCDALRTNKLLEVPFVILRSLVLGKESQRSMIFLNLYAVMPLQFSGEYSRLSRECQGFDRRQRRASVFDLGLRFIILLCIQRLCSLVRRIYNTSQAKQAALGNEPQMGSIGNGDLPDSVQSLQYRIFRVVSFQDSVQSLQYSGQYSRMSRL